MSSVRSAHHGNRLNSASHQAIAARVYEVCVTRGYVDQRDWIETAKQVKRELARERASRGQRAEPGGDAGQS